MGIVVMGNLCSPSLRLALVAGISIVAALTQARAGGIGGETSSSTASAPPLAKHPESRDDYDVTTTYGIAALSSSFLIKDSAAEFPGYDFVFAGIGPIGEHFTPIDESAFEISTYTPWVVNSPDLVSNGGRTYNRGVVNQDAGGVNILIDYIPTGSDPDDRQFPSSL
jgi:hypothetical protein